MKKTLAALIATTALTAAIGLPVWSATHITANVADAPIAAVDQGALPLILADNDDDDDHGDRSGEDDEDDDDDDDACRGASSPAPAGTVAPPRNGLFGTGAAPRVQVN